MQSRTKKSSEKRNRKATSKRNVSRTDTMPRKASRTDTISRKASRTDTIQRNTSRTNTIHRNVANIRKERNITKITDIQAQNKMDMPLLIVVLLLVAIGIVMVLSASAPSALSDYNDSYHYVKMQGIAAILGIAVMLFLSKFNYKLYHKFYKAIYIGSVLILFTVLIPKVGMEVSGARRWINLGIQIQPSEITKIGLIISLAGYYSDSRNRFDNFWGACGLPLVATVVPIAVLYLVQNHLSAGIIIAVVTVITIIISGCQLKYLMTLGGLAVAGLSGILIVFKDKLVNGFRSDRVMAWLNPWEDTSGTSYQTVQGLYAIGSGGLFGVGLGESKQKYLYIPEAHNDFIFAILAEELGFIGCLLVIVLFAILVVRGVLIAIRAEDVFGSLIAIGITALIAVQVILNIAVVTNTIPNTRHIASIFKLWWKFINHTFSKYGSAIKHFTFSKEDLMNSCNLQIIYASAC